MTVIEFLGGVPLLQKLPRSSLQKIAEAVRVRHYGEGEYVVHEGDVGEGLYFIWEGEAEVSGLVDSEDPDFHLSKYDYFGHGTATTVHMANVIALSKLTCLVLPLEHCTLLQTKSIWNADEQIEKRSLVEQILHLEPIEVNIFQGFTLPDAPTFGKTEEEGFDHQVGTMPSVPAPETLLSMEQLRERRLIDPRLPRSYRNKVATTKFIPWPIEIRFCEPSNATNQTETPPSVRYWFRAKGKLSDDQALHRMWFHRPLRADDWILFDILTPTAHNARGFVSGQMFNRNGEEGLIREAKTSNPPSRSKL
ncbi:hypothetical protein CDL15_Pgr003621 [Punica granatum]|uniref:Cyclic nucleotide-binding domain-containing protein n=1 Tax=Punica granatum TaxID=22663 RepID=A0A218XUA5_PUNGR|nr:hypothetical protein CDL15_Pgr003621 [Punica granatum]